MTKKYKVTIYYDTYIEVEVESHNPDENYITALAYCEAGNKKYDNQFLEHAQSTDYSEIEEVEDEDEDEDDYPGDYVPDKTPDELWLEAQSNEAETIYFNS